MDFTSIPELAVIMSLGNLIFGREWHWRKTEGRLLEELIDNARLISDDGFRTWVISFLSATHRVLGSIFLAKTSSFPEIIERLTSLSKKSFLSLHTVFLVQQIALCRSKVDYPIRAIDELAKVLGTTAKQLEDEMNVYNQLEGTEVSFHLNRQVSRILGLSEMNMPHMFLWINSIVFIAELATKKMPEVAMIVEKYRTLDELE